MPNITIECPDSIMYKLGRNAEYGNLQVELDRLPQNALFYVFDYGLRQVLNDAIATKENKDGNKLSATEIGDKAYNKLQALYDGTLRTRSEAIASDPYEAEAFKEMKRHLTAVLTKNGQMYDIPKGTKDRFMYAVNRMMAKNGKPETTEREYLLDRLTNTKIGQVIKAQAIAAVDLRHAAEAEYGDVLGDALDNEREDDATK